MYRSAPLHKSYEGIDILVEKEKATVLLEVNENHHHAGGSMHGSVYFKILDDAAYFSLQSIIQDYFIVTTQFNIQLFRPVISGQLKAIGKIDMMTKDLYSASSVLFDAKGRKLGQGNGQFMKSKVKLEEVDSYC